MRLEMTLPEQPGFLHAVAVVNLFALVLMFVLLGPSLVLQPGMMVDPPPSQFQLERYRDAVVVTLGPGEPHPRVHLGREAVTMEELEERLERLKEEGAAGEAVVLVQTDGETPVNVEREVTEMAVGKGFRVALVGRAGSGR